MRYRHVSVHVVMVSTCNNCISRCIVYLRVQATRGNFNENLARLLNTIQPTCNSTLTRVVELSRACLPPPAIHVASSPVQAVDETPAVAVDDDGDVQASASTNSVGDMSSSYEEEAGLEESDEDGSESQPSDTSVPEDDAAITAPSIPTPLLSSPEITPPTRISALDTAILPSLSDPVPSPGVGKGYRALKKDDVFQAVSDAVLIEDYSVAGYVPFFTVWSSRLKDVEAVRAKCGIPRLTSLAAHFATVAGAPDSTITPVRANPCMH